jgi:hypothetical protein
MGTQLLAGAGRSRPKRQVSHPCGKVLGAEFEPRSVQLMSASNPIPLSIDCGDCVMAQTAACSDCIVSFIVNREPGDAIVIDVDEQRTLRLLTNAGLVPKSQHRTRAS